MKYRPLSPFLALLFLMAAAVTPGLRAQEAVVEQALQSADAVSAPVADAPPADPLPERDIEAPVSAPVSEVSEPVAVVHRGEVVVIGNNVLIAENERASEVVVINGNVEVRGRVDGDVVAIMGNAKIDGPVGSAVAVMGKVELGENGSVAHEVVSIGGGVANPFNVPIVGERVEIAPFLPDPGALLGWFGDLMTRFRLLSPGIAWPWYVFGGGLFFYLLVALVFGRGVNACAQVLEQKPGTTLVTAIALLPMVPVFLVLLIATGVGILLLPFAIVALLFGFVFGKTAVLAFLGRSVLRPLGGREVAGRAGLAVLLGAVLLGVLYCVPVLSLLLWALTAWVGLGMVAAAILENRRAEKVARANEVPPRSKRPAVASPVGVARAAAVSPVGAESVETRGEAASASAPVDLATVAALAAVAVERGSLDSMESGGGEARAVGGAIPPVMPAVGAKAAALPDVATLPRADFWVRLGAISIDIVLVAAAGGVSGMLGLLPFPLVFAGYVFGLWLWRGTTVGGIVFNLRVVRLDGRPVDAATSLVRTLVAFLSVVVAGLGFLWCLWDPERQTWHDKVAGTVVVQEPKARSLV